MGEQMTFLLGRTEGLARTRKAGSPIRSIPEVPTKVHLLAIFGDRRRLGTMILDLRCMDAQFVAGSRTRELIDVQKKS
jgi:hypothetical protein